MSVLSRPTVLILDWNYISLNSESVCNMSWRLKICGFQSTVCERIIGALEQNGLDRHHRRVEVISQECFYRTLDENERQLAIKGQFDFDHPGAVAHVISCILYIVHYLI